MRHAIPICVYVYIYVCVEINANVFTPLSFQFEKLSLCQPCKLLCPDIDKAGPCFNNTKRQNDEENDDTICSMFS